jgi:hypothetical protein
MKHFFKAGIALLFISFIFSSCQKSTEEPLKKNPDLLTNPKTKAAVRDAIKSYIESKGSGNGAEFIAPFFSGAGFGLGYFNFQTGDYEGAYFETELNEGDFYRKNPDGTITVKINSSNALAIYEKTNWFDPNYEGIYMEGTSGHFLINYTGTLVEWPIYDEEGNLLFIIRFIDTFNSGKIENIRGQADVRENESSPTKKLRMTWFTTPAGKFKYEYSLR